MKRRDFYIEYYNRTDRVFFNKFIWGEKEREEARRKGRLYTTKLERKIFIALQYVTLLLCWIPMCIERELWCVIPIGLLCFFLETLLTDFSIIKIEILYFIYRRSNVYCSVLYDIFLGRYTEMLYDLTRLTKKEVTGYVFISGGKFFGKFDAVCRNKNKAILDK